MSNELQNIKALEQELIEAQRLDFFIKSTDGRNPIQKIVDKYAGLASLYSDPAKLQRLIEELEDALEKYITSANITGRILGKKAMDKFLLKSEIQDRTQKEMRKIILMNQKDAEKRLKLALTELQKEATIFKYDIDIFVQNAKIAGFTEKEILMQLVRAGNDKAGIAQGLAERTKSITAAAVRREKTAAEIEEYKKYAGDDELWVWITISATPCPDCQERAGKVLTMDRWENMGIPGAGRTICGRFCRCKLVPESIADKQFPNVREFNIDTKKLVLTTASEERVLEADRNKFNWINQRK